MDIIELNEYQVGALTKVAMSGEDTFLVADPSIAEKDEETKKIIQENLDNLNKLVEHGFLTEVTAEIQETAKTKEEDKSKFHAFRASQIAMKMFSCEDKTVN